MLFQAEKYGIIPGEDVSVALQKLFSIIGGTQGENELVFAPGTYYLNAESCKEDMLYITNTVSDGEFSDEETPHRARVGLYLKDISNLKIHGNGAVFMLDGKMTNAALINCENVDINDIEIRAANPDSHEFSVVGKTRTSVDFKLDESSTYCREGSSFCFTGKDYKTDFFQNRNAVWGWFGKIFADNKNHICRVRNPFYAALSIKETGQNLFKVSYLSTSRFTTGETYCLFNTRRQYVGIFADKSKNIVLHNVSQRFNYSLAFVAQDCENITLDCVDFSPAPDSAKRLVSLADFMQFCMCRGMVKVTGSNFCGAGDDCLNVHGIHFKIIKINGRQMLVRLMHPQSHGFNPLRIGDTVEFINPTTLLPSGSAVITASTLVNETDIELMLDSVEGGNIGMVIEDTTACPDLVFTGNKLTRIITRGLLVTTRGKVLIEGNDFDNTEMAAILFSDDAKSWYESGLCTDVTIKGNRFGDCGAYNIQILPENGKTGSVVHGDFVIENNTFEKSAAGGIDANNSRSVTFKENSGSGLKEGFLKSRNISKLRGLHI